MSEEKIAIQGQSKWRSSLSVLSPLFRTKSAKLGVLLVVGFFLMILIGSFLTPYSPYETTSATNSPPSLTHPFGTDYLGHDVFSQIISGAGPSMFVGFLAALGAVALGETVGVLAGYYGKLEGGLTGTADVLLTFPPLPLMLLLGSLYPPTNTLLVLILIVVLWPAIARAIRSQVLSLKERPYVDAAKAGGMKDREIIWNIMVPQVTSIAIAYFVLTLSAAIVLVTALEYIGVGNPEIVSWGSILYWAQQFAFYLGDWWWILAPGISISIVAGGFALIGFSVEEIMNPKLRV
jgi:peptide/nickel transport system permease protein